ncbi:MAG: neutral/alkaline non-lysosomal ceramidase N-terminal domain-containing protein [Candidatus Hydrogenedentes bacterium]|nr:neutral/alkaline non-lysosomal ceramidase N-terminal domain-containing protein [Candidatus Hydrogenedentota bacterium]
MSSYGASFKVGFSQRDITPTESVPMWGYAQENRPDFMSDGILDPLHAKAIVIGVSDTKLALVGLDLGRAPTQAVTKRVQRAVRERAGVDHILLVASHTHHGPVLELTDLEGEGKGKYDAALRYVNALEGHLVDAIVEAASSARDARVGWGKADCLLNRNRHSSIAPVPVDTDLVVIRFEDLDGKPIATLVNYAAHPTVHPPQNRRFTAEFPGVMMREVERVTGAPCVFLQGAAGDLQCEMNDDLWGKEDFIEPIGKALARHVVDVTETIHTEIPLRPSIVGKTSAFEVSTRIDLSDPNIRAGFGAAYFPEIVAAFANNAFDEAGRLRPQMSTVLLNDKIFFVGVSGEFFCNHAIRLKARARVPVTVFAGYCNEHHFYFPTIEAAAEGGYGADPASAWVEVGTGERMMDQALEDLYEFQGKSGG